MRWMIPVAVSFLVVGCTGQTGSSDPVDSGALDRQTPSDAPDDCSALDGGTDGSVSDGSLGVDSGGPDSSPADAGSDGLADVEQEDAVEAAADGGTDTGPADFILWSLNNEPASNASSVVELSDPTDTTKSMLLRMVGNRSLKSVTVGVNPAGGGYVDYLTFNDETMPNGTPKNLIEYYYGRGSQFAFRDRYHGGRYNPTQAGFTDSLGAPVRLVRVAKGIRVPNFNLPIFEALGPDAVFDFSALYASGPNAVRSELDGALEYIDVTERLPVAVRIPTLQVRMGIQYRRSPEVIRNFTGPNAYVNETLLARPALVQRVSEATFFPSVPAPSADDLSAGMLAHVWRFNIEQAPFVWLYTRGQGGVGTPVELETGKDDKIGFVASTVATAPCPLVVATGAPLRFCDAGLTASLDYLVLGDASGVDSARAFGVFLPPTRGNRLQSYVWDDGAKQVVWSENRIVESHYTMTRSTPTTSLIGNAGQMRIGYNATFSGMLNPTHEALRGGVGPRWEGLEQTVLLFFGTPREIQEAVEAWRMQTE